VNSLNLCGCELGTASSGLACKLLCLPLRISRRLPRAAMQPGHAVIQMGVSFAYDRMVFCDGWAARVGFGDDFKLQLR
jgi:hypothetical protein